MVTPTLNMQRGVRDTFGETRTLRIEIDRPFDRLGRCGFTLIWTLAEPDDHGRTSRAQCFFAEPGYYIGRFIERCAGRLEHMR